MVPKGTAAHTCSFNRLVWPIEGSAYSQSLRGLLGFGGAQVKSMLFTVVGCRLLKVPWFPKRCLQPRARNFIVFIELCLLKPPFTKARG